MRALLTTLAVMATISPAIAADINADPEGSVVQSTYMVQPAETDADMAKMEPAAGVETPAITADAQMMQKDSDPEGSIAPSM